MGEMIFKAKYQEMNKGLIKNWSCKHKSFIVNTQLQFAELNSDLCGKLHTDRNRADIF